MYEIDWKLINERQTEKKLELQTNLNGQNENVESLIGVTKSAFYSKRIKTIECHYSRLRHCLSIFSTVHRTPAYTKWNDFDFFYDFDSNSDCNV